jgi:hypothetical protein
MSLSIWPIRLKPVSSNRRSRRRGRKLQPKLQSLESRTLLSITPTAVTIAPTESAAFTGAVATFTATDAGPFSATIDWGDSTTTTATIAQNGGVFTVNGSHTYAEDGASSVTVVISDSFDSTTATAVSTANVAEADLTATASSATLSTTEGATASGLVATFTDTASPDAASAFAATINWGDGTTDTATVTGSAGTFSVNGSHSYVDEGNFQVLVTVTETGIANSTSTASFTAQVADADALTGTGSTVAATEGTALTTTGLATFTDTLANSASDFTGTIDWGDGTTTTGTVSGSAGSFTVDGTHAYADEGKFTIVTTLTDVNDDGSGLATATATATSTANVADADSLTGTGSTVAATEGTAFTSSGLATFTDTLANSASDFTSTIDWGDGTTTTGTVSGSAGSFTVDGTHTYADEGKFTIVTTLTDVDDDGSGMATATATATSTANVAEGDVLTGTGATVAATEGTAFTSSGLATFADTLANSASDFTSSIDWGDGTTTTGTVSGSAGSFTVDGVHTYAEDGSYTVNVTLTDVDDDGSGLATASASAASTVNVAEADLTATASSATLSTTEGATASGVVATFTDTASPDAASAFAATINWGDGTTDTATVTGSAGAFTVNGSHSYSDEGNFHVLVTVTETGVADSTSTASFTAQVADADSLTGTGSTVAATEGTAFTSTGLATFTDTLANSASDFIGTIDWGDGTSSTGTISGSAGSFTVDGVHTYADEGNFTIVTTLTDVDDDGSGMATATATATSTANVAEGDVLTGTGATVAATEATAFTSSGLATFTDTIANSASDFSSTIDWGDGTTTTGTVSGSAGSFTVDGNHTYADEGSFTVVTKLTDVDDDGSGMATATATATSTVNVAEGDVLAGNSDTAAATEASASTLTFAFTDSNASNVAGDFSGTIDWGDGTTTTTTVSGGAGSFTIDGVHTYADEGTFTATATLADDAPGTATGTSTVAVTVAEADSLSAGTGQTISATEGIAFGSTTLATFSDTNTAAPASDFTAIIDWGDGSSSTGTVAGGSGSFTASGNHTYAEEGAYSIQVVLIDDSPGTATTAVLASANVTDQSVVATGGFTVGAVEQNNSGDQVVATFTDPAGPEPVANYSATIDWGDGTTSAGTISQSGATYSVTANHTYAEDGNFALAITVHHETAADVTVAGTADVTEAPIGVTPVAVTGTEFAALANVTLATFTHGDGSEPASEFTATVDWGDGASSAATVSLTGTTYTVSGSHTYTDERHYSPVVSVSDASQVGGTPTTVTTSALIHEQLLPGGIVGTENQRFVSEVYRDFLNRAVDSGGLAFWSAQLDAGASRVSVVSQIMASGPTFEFYGDVVQAAFAQYLHRGAEPAAVSFYTTKLSEGLTEVELDELIVDSPEYFNVQGGGTNDGFLDALFRDALHRSVDPAAKIAFDAFFAVGGTTAEVADIVFHSIEFEHDLVESIYGTLLDRPADPGGLDAFTAALRSGVTDFQIMADIASSQEYLNKTLV